MANEIKIPFSPPDVGQEEIDAVAEVMRSGWLTTGPKTKELERRIADYCKVGRAVCLNSATASLEMSLHLFGIGPGDEVIVPAYTYTASASVVCHVGATLRLVDVEKGNYHIDYDALEAMINSKTKAVIPVDVAGIMVDYDRIRQIVEAKKHLFTPENDIQDALGRVLILADSAHGFGSVRNGRISGQCADFTCFSFHAVKNLVMGEGGGIVWRDIDGIDNEDIYNRLMLLSLHGQSKDALAKTKLGAWEYDILNTYYKCNITDIASAMGLVQLKKYDSLIKRRLEIAKMYYDAIACDEVDVIKHETEEYISNGHLMLVRLLNSGEAGRNELITKMAEKGIATNVHYKPLPMHTAYKNLGFDIKDFPNAYEMYHNEISLPIHTKLTDSQVEYVIENFDALRRTI